MNTSLIFLAIAAWLYLGGGPEWLRSRTRRIRSRIRGGAGASATARARQLRTPAVRIAEAFGIRTQAGALAARSEAGAEGEQRTAVRLAPLTRRGWTILHDRALPRGHANVDHIAISPTGVVLVLDTKRWSARYPITVQHGRLHHGHRDVTDRLAGLRHEAATVAEVLRTTVVPVVLMDGPALVAEQLELDGIRIIAAADARRLLPAIARTQRSRIPRPRIAADADRLLPPYTQGLDR
ncbi:nuclease-related domain-containing protein [Streptomyces griseorubiginosus]|uniref:nuclease-related domain-containing protein n=1 Tax=Streptomyces griseorubiginosus TaxID=67304 RepID=UPI0036974F5E